MVVGGSAKERERTAGELLLKERGTSTCSTVKECMRKGSFFRTEASMCVVGREGKEARKKEEGGG